MVVDSSTCPRRFFFPALRIRTKKKFRPPRLRTSFVPQFLFAQQKINLSENVFVHLRNWTNINTPKNDALKQVISNSFTIWQLLLDIDLLNFRWVCITLVVSRSMHGVCCDVSGKTFTWKADINYGWLLGLTAPVLLHLFEKKQKLNVENH